VLAGGTSRRWGGRDKTAAGLGGVPVLVHATLAAVHGVLAARGFAPGRVVVVAGSDHPARPEVARSLPGGSDLAWTREEPAGGGPVAGLAAGLRSLEPRPGTAVVVAGDLPFGGDAVPRLLTALAAGNADAALGVDPSGRRQPLLGAYRTAPLGTALAAGDPAGRSLRSLVAGLAVVQVPVTEREAYDLDTPQDLAAAEHLLRRAGEPPGFNLRTPSS
jgi:molybdopterin-guanine dinucleotide biosynthesis protein A